jgi:hypothetical protein
MGRLQRFSNGPANGWNRRILVVARRPGDGPLTEPTAAARACRREPVFLPLSSRHFSENAIPACLG